MTSIERPLADVPLTQLVVASPSTRFGRFEALLERASERLNPILVKEARQALRSRQFTITFFLMLLAGWAWSVVGLASIGPAANVAAEGPNMFYVYHLILAFPLLVVAPYSAFHSLSAERQDRTYELVSITSLGARQILTGKLGSVALQMVVYLSAIFPCLAFTYLLRGLDIFTIAVAVLYTACTSLGLAVLGLMLAAAAPARQRQVIVGVLFTILLCGAFVLNSTWTNEIVMSGLPVDSADFWGMNAVLAAIYLNYFALVFLAARSLLLTVSQNRSTALRVSLVVAQTSILSLMIFTLLRFTPGDAIAVFAFVLTIFWYAAGVFLTGEPDVLPPRVKRDLPQTTLGRVFLTWFTPGSGTGYMFAIVNLLTAMMFLLLPYSWMREALVQIGINGGVAMVSVGTIRPGQGWEGCTVALSYLVIYLGIGRLLLLMIARFSEVRIATRVVVHVLLLLLGCGIPWVVQMSTPVWRDMDYTLIQTSNAVWTLSELCSRGLALEMPVLIIVLPTVALGVWLANVPSLLRELKQVRIARPERMIEEETELAAAAARVPRNPWELDDQ